MFGKGKQGRPKKTAIVEEPEEDDEEETEEEDEEDEEPYSKEKVKLPSLNIKKPAPKKSAKILRKSEDIGEAGIITTIVYMSNERIYDSLGEVGQEFNLD